MCSCQWDFVLFWRKACQRLIYRQQNEKNYFAYTKPAFLRILHSLTARNCLVFTFVQPSCVHSSASTSSKNLLGPGFFKVDRQHHMNSYCRTDGCKVQSGMPTLFALQNHVSWQEIFQRLPGPVQRLGTANVGDAWKQLGTF